MGLITAIQRFSLHDGPGIRTTVFVKGCNMRCAWCHNPETISFEPQELFHPEKCIHCGKCSEGCFSGARVMCGKQMTPEEVLAEVIKDKPYYGADGGVTVSGGEPGCQPEFTAEILRLARENGLRTAIETNLNYSENVLKQLMPYTDLIMADLKIFDEEKHKQYTGCGNARTKANLEVVTVPLIVRTPVIAGINDTPAEIESIARFASGLKPLMYYELLPYHALGLSKGAGEQKRFSAPDRQKLHELCAAAGKWCGDVRISGKKEKTV